MNDPVAATTLGRIRGRTVNGIHAFKGVRYAAPAGGQNRFRPPAPARPWSGIATALEYGPCCPQIGMPPPGGTARTGTDRSAETDEDCLFLNLWTPGLGDGARRPVLVWLHGGAFRSGSGSKRAYDGTALAHRGDVVAVTVNHRLGLLGHLHLADLTDDERYACAGQAGMLDLVVALEWVRDNAEAFGGDPGNVLIYGVSGGGAKVSALMSMPRAAGLFHRAAIQSGAVRHFRLREEASAQAADVLEKVGLTASATPALPEVPVARLLDVHAELIRRAGGVVEAGFAVSPFVGDDVLPLQPADALAAGSSGSVPLLIGCTREEFTRFLPRTGPATDEQVRARLAAELGDDADRLVSAYRAAAPDADPGDLLIWLLSDKHARLPAIELAERKASGGPAGVYQYLLTWPSPALDGWARATHSLCTPLVMDNCEHSELTGPYAQSRVVASAMSDAWIAFARSGDPNHAGLPPWRRYDTADRMTMLFDVPSQSASDPYGDRRRAWDRVPA